MLQTLQIRLATIFIVSAALTGCVSEDPSLEGISMSGGNAIAHNSALQIVDPWPSNVHDNDLTTPANRGTPSNPGSTAAALTPVANPPQEAPAT